MKAKKDVPTERVESAKSIFRYNLACMLCEYGIPEAGANAYISANYINEWGGSTVRAMVRKAYKNCVFGSTPYISIFCISRSGQDRIINVPQTAQGEAKLSKLSISLRATVQYLRDIDLKSDKYACLYSVKNSLINAEDLRNIYLTCRAKFGIKKGDFNIICNSEQIDETNIIKELIRDVKF